MTRLFCFLALLLPVCTALAADAPGVGVVRSKVYISGRVLAADTNEPVSDAAISLLPAEGGAPLQVARTLVNGSFLLAAPGPGGYILRVDGGINYNGLERKLDLTTAGLSGITLPLSQPPLIRLQVLGQDGQPVQGGMMDVQVLALPDDHPGGLKPFWLTQPAKGTWGSRQVSADGMVKAVMPHSFAPTEILQVGIGVRDEKRGCARVFLDRWPTEKVQVRLQPGVTLSGTVLDAAGKGVPNAPVRGVGMSSNLGFRFLQGQVETRSDETGHFSIPSLFQDRYDLETEIPGAGRRFHLTTLKETANQIHITPADRQQPPPDRHFFRTYGEQTGTAKLDLLRQRLDAPPDARVTITGKVTASETGKDVPGVIAELMALTPGEATLEDAVQAAPDGSYVLSAPGPGQYIWLIQAAGRSSVQNTITVPAGGLSLDTPMQKAVDLEVSLLGPDGKPVTAGQVRSWNSYRWPNGSSASGSTRPFPEVGFLTFDAPQNIDKLQQFVLGVQVPTVGCGQWRFDHWPSDPITLRLSAGSTLVGMVVDDNGKPAANVTITLSPNIPGVPLYTLDSMGRFDQTWSGYYNDVFSCAGNLTTVADAGGKFQIEHLMVGEYEVRVKIPGLGLRYHMVTLTGSETTILLSPRDAAEKKATYTAPDG